MRLFPILALALTALGGSLSAAEPINFKVGTVYDSSNEGPERPRPFITMGARKICFSQPAFCDVSSGPEGLTVYLSKEGQLGQFSVTNSSFKPEVDFIAQTEDYFKAAEATLPKEAEAIEFKGANSSLYVVNQWKSIAFDWNYTIYAKAVHRQVAYINIDAEHQVCLTIVSSDETAPAALATALRFMKSWYFADGLNGTLR